MLPTEKKERLLALFDALFHYFGGAHLSNYFTKTYPEILIIAILNRKLPIFGDKIRVDGKMQNGKYKLNVDSLKEILSTFDDCIEKIMIGGFQSTISNWGDIENIANSNQKVEVTTMENLMNEIENEEFFTDQK